MENWQRALLKAAGFGAGFAVVSGMIALGFLWWSSRPSKPKPWDDGAMTAFYESLDTEGEDNTFRFTYTVQNNTDNDYRVVNDSEIKLAALLKRSQALSFGDGQGLHTDFPIYLPAKSRVRFEIHLNYPYPIRPDYQASEEERRDFQTKAAQYVTKELSNIDGFVLLDESVKERISFPSGWAERAKMSIATKTGASVPTAK